MPSDAAQPVHCIACSLFSNELEALRAEGSVDFPVTYVSSMLHMNPSQLRDEIDSVLAGQRDAGRSVLLLFGDCHPHMLDVQSEPGVARVEGINCCEIVLGSDRFRKLRREGAFFLMPEWALRWRELFGNELGLHGETARQFMQEMHTRLVYLDTGQAPVPLRELDEISEFSGLPWEVVGVSLGHLWGAITAAMTGLPAHAI